MDIGLMRPDTLPLTIVKTLLMVVGEVDMCPIPSTIPPMTQVTMVDCCVYLLIFVLFMKLVTTMKEVIVGVMMENVELGLKRPATITLTTTEETVMVMREVDICLIPDPTPPIILVSLVDCLVF